MNTCTNCQKEIPDRSKFCKYCGIRQVNKIGEKVSIQSKFIEMKQENERGEYSGSHKEFPNASQQKRFINYLIDSFGYMGFSFVIGFVIALLNSSNTTYQDSTYSFIGFLAFVLYYALCEFWWGKTLGKVITKTKVVYSTGEEITFGTAIKRSLIRIIPFEFLSINNSTNLMWHDKWTNTHVVDESKDKVPINVLEQQSKEYKRVWDYSMLQTMAVWMCGVLVIVSVVGLFGGKELSGLINFVLIAAGLVGFGWLMLGIPLALIDMFKKSNKENARTKFVPLGLFGGLVMLAEVFIAYALVALVSAFLGISILNTT